MAAFGIAVAVIFLSATMSLVLETFANRLVSLSENSFVIVSALLACSFAFSTEDQKSPNKVDIFLADCSLDQQMSCIH